MGVLKSGHPRNLTGLGWIACWTMSFKIQEIDRDVNLVSNSLHLARPFQYGVSDVWHQLTANALGKQDSLFHVAVKSLTDQFLFNKYQLFLAFFPSSFFVVEDHVLHTTQGLVNRAYVEELWELALSKITAALRTHSVRAFCLNTSWPWSADA